ncbi:Uncharacterized protein HZ326_18585 [Fusarium oxysporum f. sp. albedinis]|nr:Uncharacterized protein HZ326_23431 [Fusarium oxysporum f. sp. albedinis]KAJ0138467.1 Uncharacterized protein HZ326_18585 [Fusarium oxysporum f. sp. albedinis]
MCSSSSCCATLSQQTSQAARGGVQLLRNKATYLNRAMVGPDGIRTAVTLAESRVDYRDRQFLFLSSSHRVARHRFR